MKHETLEKNSILLLVCILIAVSIGGLIQIAPLYWVESTIEKVKGITVMATLMKNSSPPPKYPLA